MSLLPLPRQQSALPGEFVLPEAWDGHSPAPWLSTAIVPSSKGQESYTLEIDERGARIQAGGEAGRFYALQSLQQLLRQAGQGKLALSLPKGRIEDHPHFAIRGLSLDISRGRVPRRDTLMRFIDGLAELKINQLQLYTEHTFAFKGHPLIGQGCSPLTADDILALDEHCAQRHIELVPSLASFGHMSKVLGLEPYRHLAEDLGTGVYQKPDLDPEKLKEFEKGWTLSPVNEAAYSFLDSLYAEYLPLFRSKKFNACCDETFDLGWGQSYPEAQAKGLAELFARHILRLRELSLAHGKTEMLIWGDVLHSHPVILQSLPKDIVVLDWSYNEDADFKKMSVFTQAGLKTYACPSTNTWGTLFPRLPVGLGNISGFAKAAVELKAAGFLNTIWGDHGHFNSPRLEWAQLALGAELAWNPQAAEQGPFLPRFCRDYLGLSDQAFANALADLGDRAASLGHGDMENVFSACYLAAPSAGIFKKPGRAFYWSEKGQVHRQERPLDAAFCQDALQAMRSARVVIAAGFAQEDRRSLGPDYLWGIDAMILGAEKWLELSAGPALSAGLKQRMAEHRQRFEALWALYDQPSEIEKTLVRMRAAV